ncbi:MAG TPA: UDP-N-acetylmuramoyl-L-alanyl-D-glutamate--2,6-diaminopimelate ligase [Candidatus Saccharimonadales bacterium]|jgi:UDP-N-acetylmuramoyl-L-alanyl-D-glutamate--2,6-diaminopimelate ligase|nr:UDP-N-acetylmuramoyl-L-alanyl-D-glutamate--2,6-diaminopimelate ligase [Candidatus Saccharimonadales bacterium]
MRTLIKKLIPRDLFRKIEPTGHLLEAVVRNTLAGFPAHDLKVIGVTGTNGKTSTSFLIHRMLHEAGYKVGLMTTVAYGAGLDIKPQIEHMTTASVPQLIARIKELKAQGIEWLVLETTSHALAQYRVWGIPYSVAVLTNLTHEHLDYHGTFERYRDAKKMLFTQTSRNRKGLQTGVINADDPNADIFAAATTHPLMYGCEHGDLRATNIVLSPDGVRYDATVANQVYHIACQLPGSFNVYNSLAAVGVGRAVGLTPKQIEQGIAALSGVEGRMTRIDEGQDFSVIVDYAHTPDSFEKLLHDIKPVVKGKLRVLFGSAGRRDEEKRAVQGRIAGSYADEVIVTEEDDRDMDGQEIMEQIAGGAESAGKKRDKDLFLVHDRDKAIQFVVDRARKDDTILLLGKGHEKDILRNGPRAAELRHLQQDDHDPERVIEIPWDEIGTAHAALKKRLGKK